MSRAARDWTARERRTARLIKLVYSCIKNRPFKAEDLSALCELTWITKNPQTGEPSPAYLTSTKLPALSTLLGSKTEEINDVMDQLVKSTGCSLSVARSLIKGETGIVNFYTPYRGKVSAWCGKNAQLVSRIIRDATSLASDDEARALCERITDLPTIKMKANDTQMKAANLLSPLIACLDPRSRYPIVNKPILSFVHRLGLGSLNPVSQHVSLVRLMDALKIDAFALDQMDRHSKKAIKRYKLLLGNSISSRQLGSKNDSDVKLLHKQLGKKMRRLHNCMTNRLVALLGARCEESVDRDTMWDVVVRPSNKSGRPTLVEIKTGCNMPSARMAVGQLFDYRRNFPRLKNRDLAVLFPSKPDKGIQNYLNSVKIQTLWFTDKKLRKVRDHRKVLWD